MATPDDQNQEAPGKDNSNDHDVHPSLANLKGVIGSAKQGLDAAAVPQNYKVKRVQTAVDLESGDLRPFKQAGQQKFRILVSGIALFEDKSLSEAASHISLDRDAIVAGTYLYDDNNVVLLGDPYNVYCNAADVEPEDLSHAVWLDQQREADDINAGKNAAKPKTQSAGDSDANGMTTNEENEENDANDGNIHEDAGAPQETDKSDDVVPAAAAAPQNMDTVRVLPGIEENKEQGPQHTDNVAVQEARSSHAFSSKPRPHKMQSSATISAIPDDHLDDVIGLHYPEDQRPSFIQALPAKIPSPRTNDQQPVFPQASSMPDYHKQASQNRQNPNFVVSLNASQQQQHFFDAFALRTLCVSLIFLVFCVLSFPQWFESGVAHPFKTAYGLCAAGVVLIFLAALISLLYAFFAIKNNSVPFETGFKYAIMSTYIAGGMAYIFGGGAMANSFTVAAADVAGSSTFSAIWFVENLYIACVAIIVGIDAYKTWLNEWQKRVTVYTSLFLFCGFILAICYLINAANDQLDSGQFAFVGVAYILCVIPAFFVFAMQCLKKNVDNVWIMLTWLVCFVILAVAYWNYGAQQLTTPLVVYRIGFGLFQLSMGLFLTFDISFCHRVLVMLRR